MIKYAICEFGGKLYKVVPNKPFEVNFSGDEKNLQVNVLLSAENGKLKVGKPYLKDKLKLKVLQSYKGKKIRVFKYHAKANYRKVYGFRPLLSKVVLEV